MNPAGTGAASVVTIAAGDGAKARVHPDGAHVVSWIPAGADDVRLFLSPKSGYGPGVAIRGGIPVCCPQFGGEGPLPQHGFARTSTWTPVEHRDGERDAAATFRLIDNDATRALWPHPFAAELTVRVGGNALETALVVHNTGGAPFAFTAALHTYLRVEDAYRCTIEGLEGARYRDALQGGRVLDPAGEPLTITGETDRVYLDVPGAVTVRDPSRARGARSTRVEATGFRDVVVWNPGPTGVARKPDMHEGDDVRMICIEAAAVAVPIVVAPGTQWRGAQRLSV